MPDPENDDEERRGRPFWSGLLSFGLVSIPVELLASHRSTGGALHMIDEDGTRLARRYYGSADEKELDPDQLVRGYELDDGKVVVVSDEELEALAPKKSREIDLRLFVDRDGIDPLYFERSYFLAPGEGSGKAYRLLVAVMEESRRAGVATFVMRDKEYLVAIFAEGGLLRAETLRFHDEVRSTRDVGLPKPPPVDDATAKRVQKALASLEQQKWDPSELADPHEALRELAERKYKQRKDVLKSDDTSAASGGAVVDLMEVLKKSLAQNDLAPRRAPSGAASKKKGSARTRTSAHSAPRKKAAARSSRGKVSVTRKRAASG
ncbi:MAG: Ku protein [Polyangiaceae bacterium]